jgi:hypothetical protein
LLNTRDCGEKGVVIVLPRLAAGYVVYYEEDGFDAGAYVPKGLGKLVSTVDAMQDNRPNSVVIVEPVLERPKWVVD